MKGSERILRTSCLYDCIFIFMEGEKIMKKLCKNSVLMLLMIAMLCTTICPMSSFAASKKTTTYYVTTKAGLRLRKSPSTSGKIITTMPYASSVSVYSISNGWAYLTYKGKTGYASIQYLSTKNTASTGNKKTKLSYALYHNSSARISCNFDGYKSKKNSRHEGIDFVLRNGAPIYSLVSGIVTRVSYGKNGSGGLSTVAIYDSSTNKTVVYLHSKPYSLKVGAKVSKGEKIGTQSWRGVSSSSSGHTHVEVRNGRRTSAAISLKDPKLDNENPNAFWKSKGYIVQ